MDAGRPIVDWRSPTPYLALARCCRSAFAWEWLRRSAEYRRECADETGDAAARFGLHRLEPVENAVPAARPIWRRDADPAVLCASVRHSRPGGDGFDFGTMVGLGTSVDDCDGEHWLWSDGLRGIRLDVVGGTLRNGPVVLDFAIGGGVMEVGPQALTLQRLAALVRSERIVRRLFAAERRATRLALILRVHDALAAGASQCDIAMGLLGLDGRERWRIEAPSVRARVQRLVSLARISARADPLAWLRG